MKTSNFCSSVFLTAFCLLIVCDAAQIIRILSPSTLVSQFKNGLNERPALFGFPPYGSSIIGYIVDYTANSACASLPFDDSGSASIFLLTRGNCSFVTKVRYAQAAGAKAVVIMDNVDEPTLPYMADDGTASDIEIPSVLIGFSDGNKIVASIRSANVVQVVLKWSLPNPDSRVELAIWTSSGVRDSTFAAFTKNFAQVAVALDERLYVEPHYYIINGTGRCDRADFPCGSQCIMQGRYCAADPELDLSKGLTGAQVVQENLRQICLWQYLNSTGNNLMWWNYVNLFGTTCAIDETTWNDTCVNKTLKAINVDPSIIQACLNGHGGTVGNGKNDLLDAEIQLASNQAIFIIPTITINNIVYRGSTYCPTPVYQEHCGIFRAVCAGYSQESPPSACVPGCAVDDLNCADSATANSSSGISVGVVIAIVAVALVLAAAGTFLYIRRQQRKMREDLDSILQNYMPIEDGDRLANISTKDGHKKVSNIDMDEKP